MKINKRNELSQRQRALNVWTVLFVEWSTSSLQFAIHLYHYGITELNFNLRMLDGVSLKFKIKSTPNPTTRLSGRTTPEVCFPLAKARESDKCRKLSDESTRRRIDGSKQDYSNWGVMFSELAGVYVCAHNTWKRQSRVSVRAWDRTRVRACVLSLQFL